MRRLAYLTSALILADPAFAQDVPKDGEKTFWCGYAFTIVAAGVTDPSHLEGASIMAGQGELMLERAGADYLAAGFSAETISGIKVLQEETARSQVFGPSEDADFSYLECLAIATE
jgi:hypothetical protein